MTNEEAIRIAQGLITDFKCESETMVEFCNVVIKALKHESILDKIRAEITDWQTDIHDNEYDAEIYDFVFERIYEIFDENKAESEERVNE